MQTRQTVHIPPGQLDTTRNASAIQDGYLAAAHNCRRGAGVFQLCRRQRKFSARGSAFSSGQSQGLGLALYGESKELFAFNNNSVMAMALSLSKTGVGSVSNFETTVVTSDLTAGDWFCWPHRSLLLAAGGANGNVIVIDPGAANNHSASLLYKNYSIESGSFANLSNPPYLRPAWSLGDTYSTVNSDTVTTSFQDIDGEDWAWSVDHWDPSGYHTTFHNMQVTFAATKDWSRHDYVGYLMRVRHGNYWGGNFASGATLQEANGWAFRVKSGGTWYICPITVRYTNINAAKEIGVFADLTGVSRAARATITDIMICAVMNRDGIDGFNVSPITLGATFLQANSGDDIADFSPTDFTGYINYAYSYKEGATESDAIPVFVSSSEALGEQYKNLPRMGGKVTISVDVISDSPFTSTSSILLYRKKTNGDWVEVTNSGLPGGPSRGVNALGTNSESPAVVDNLTQAEVDSLSPVAITVGSGVDPTASGLANGVVCGATWKGSAVYGGSDGKVYMSDPTDYRNVAWPNVSVGAETIATSPRTVELAKDGSPITVVVGGDALYVFTPTSGVFFSGDVPATAPGPFELPTARGCVSPKAARQHRGGALYASWDGLYYAKAPPAAQGVASDAENVEVTSSVRASYAWLMGSTPEKTCLAVWNSEVWLFNETRFLMQDIDGLWTTGEWADSMQVKDAVTHPYYGIVLLATDGTMRVIGDFATDGGTATNGTGGTAPTWYVQSRMYVVDARLQSGKVRYVGTEPAGVSMTAYTDLPDDTITFSAKDKAAPFSRGVGGMKFQIRLSGGAGTTVYSASVDIALNSQHMGQ